MQNRLHHQHAHRGGELQLPLNMACVCCCPCCVRRGELGLTDQPRGLHASTGAEPSTSAPCPRVCASVTAGSQQTDLAARVAQLEAERRELHKLLQQTAAERDDKATRLARTEASRDEMARQQGQYKAHIARVS